MKVPLFRRLGIAAQMCVKCMHCGQQVLGRALKAHICKMAPDPVRQRRPLTDAEWQASLARQNRATDVEAGAMFKTRKVVSK